MEITTGYKRSYSVTIRKFLNEEIFSGYPKIYPTSADLVNGYFVLGGVNIPIITTEQLQNLTDAEYAVKISFLKDYVIQQEGMNPFLNQINDNVVYDPTNCVPSEIVTFEAEFSGHECILEEIVTTTTSSTTTTTTEIGITPVNYGLLYNWYAASDARNIANTGWHVPSNTEFQTLFNYLDTYDELYEAWLLAGGMLKETGTTHWAAPNAYSNNTTGFNGVGGGTRDGNDGTFFDLMANFHLWSVTTFDASNSYTVGATVYDESIGILAFINKFGFSLRLLKDDSIFTPIYTGNDGKVYSCTQIGSQVWLSVNLVETKYRNGDLIPEVTDNATWTALTTGAMCAYNNDWNNV